MKSKTSMPFTDKNNHYKKTLKTILKRKLNLLSMPIHMWNFFQRCHFPVGGVGYYI